MRREIVALVSVALPLAAVLTAAAQGSPKAPSSSASASVQIDALDRRIDPCVDFYQFACGGWVAKNPLPPDRRSYGRFAEGQEHNFTILRRILDGSTSSGSPAAARAPSGASGGEGRREGAGYYPPRTDRGHNEAGG